LAEKIQVAKIPIANCHQGRSTHTPPKKKKKKPSNIFRFFGNEFSLSDYYLKPYFKKKT
jgi:hypothetical protein